MKNLIIKNRNNCPEIKFYTQDDTAYLEISKRSLPENVLEAYKEAIEWIKEYIEKPLPKTYLNIDLEYFNSPTVRILTEIIEMFVRNNNTQFVVNWYYYDGDTKEVIEDISEAVKYKFNILPKNIRNENKKME